MTVSVLSALDAEVDPVDSVGADEVAGSAGVFGVAGPPEGRTARRGRGRGLRGPGLAVPVLLGALVLDSLWELGPGLRCCAAALVSGWAGLVESAAE